MLPLFQYYYRGIFFDQAPLEFFELFRTLKRNAYTVIYVSDKIQWAAEFAYIQSRLNS